MVDLPPRAPTSAPDEREAKRLVPFLKSLFGRKAGDSVRETIEELMESGQGTDTEDAIAPAERQLVRNSLQMREVIAEDVMVPRGDIIAIDLAMPFEAAVAAMVEAGHSRIPVYRETLDGVTGMLHIKDVFTLLVKADAARDLEAIVRPVLFVPPTTAALDLLLQMRQKRTHMALVVDEYGDIDGLITIEDLVEQIVGDIEDEHDEAEPVELVRESDLTLIAHGRAGLEELEALIGRFLADEERDAIDTVGGLIANLAGRLPAAEERVTHDPSGIVFEILAADPRRIERARIHLPVRVEGNGDG